MCKQWLNNNDGAKPRLENKLIQLLLHQYDFKVQVVGTKR